MSGTCKEVGTGQKEVKGEVEIVEIITSVIAEGKDKVSGNKLDTKNNDPIHTEGSDEGE